MKFPAPYHPYSPERTAKILARLQPAGMFRRLAAMLYDAFILLCLWMMVTFAILPFLPQHVVAPRSGWYQSYLIVWTLLYYGYFWSKRGKTPGMAAWRLQLIDHVHPERTPHLELILRRLLFSIATLGVGVLLIPFHQQKRALHDILSQTRMMRWV